MQSNSFEDVVRRLDKCNYDVRVEPDGYLIQHRDDPADVSRAATLELLLDFTELMEWAAQRQQSQQGVSADAARPQEREQ
jgi:hypothetical protein